MRRRRTEGETVSTVDTAWLRMDHPTNLMVISGYFTFDRPLDEAQVRRTLEDRLLPFSRFTRRIVPQGLFRPPRWEPDPDFSLDRHLDTVTLSGRGGEDAFRELVDRLVATPLPFDRPLWHATLVAGYRGGSAAFFRIHHAVGDGMALLRVLLSVCDPEPAPGEVSVRRIGPAPTEPDGLLRPSAGLVAAAGRFARGALREGVDLLRNPVRVLELAETGTAAARALARLTLLTPDPPSPLKGELGMAKRAAWTEAIPLAEVKATARAAGATINDLLVAHVSGALGRYLRGRGHPTDGLRIRAMVPVNIRPLDEEPDLGNRFGLVLPELPVAVEDPAVRLARVKDQMDTLKRTPEAAVSYAILQTIGATTDDVQQLIVDFFGAKSTAVLTNVPGPRRPLWFAGRRIERMMFWVPQSGRLGLGISILSYAGAVGIGVIGDEGLVPDPQAMVTAIHDIHDETARAAGLRPRAVHPPQPRCVATTVAGTRCRNHARRGSRRCAAHA